MLGFTPDELEQYFSECLKGDSIAVQTLLERTRENPVIEGSCYLPLNASVIASVFLSGDNSLPTSNHKIFGSVVQNFLMCCYQTFFFQLSKHTFKSLYRQYKNTQDSSLSLFLQVQFSYFIIILYSILANIIVMYQMQFCANTVTYAKNAMLVNSCNVYCMVF